MYIKIAIALVLCIGGVTVWGLMGGERSQESIPQHSETGGVPTYVWEFREAASLNPDGNPQTEVLLLMTYPNGTTREHRIDTVDGSCTVFDTEAFAVQCYYAGLGERYIITEEDRSYVIMRSYFEEALPNTDPRAEAWETIATIPW